MNGPAEPPVKHGVSALVNALLWPWHLCRWLYRAIGPGEPAWWQEAETDRIRKMSVSEALRDLKE